MTYVEPDATELFAEWEIQITGWEHLQQELDVLANTYRPMGDDEPRFVWRGQVDARWGVRSSLFRSLATTIGHPPTEDELVAAETQLLRLARTEWRLDGIPALQLFARMQHAGVPTRLIDVSLNPLIATWFAVAHSKKAIDRPARLLAFAESRRPLRLDSRWNTNSPRWHQLHSDHARRSVEWGTGLGRKVWRPPAIHTRIPAQSAAFIVDGVPIDSTDAPLGASPRRRADDVRRFASIPMRLSRPREGRLPGRNAPVFTYTIAADAKRDIRHQLEHRFGYNFASIYADIEGLAEYLRQRPKALTDERLQQGLL